MSASPPRNRCSVSDIVIPVVIKNPADFVGSVLGESEKNAKAILDAAVGKVLVIDEASVNERPSLTPADCSLRHTVCMVAAVKVVQAAPTTLTRPRSSTRSSLRFRVFQVKTDASCSLVTRIRW